MNTAHASPNHGARPAGIGIDVIVLHADAGTSDLGTVMWCCDPLSRVSYHYLVGRDGEVYRLVPDDRRAWHAGRSLAFGRPDVNDVSIGVSFGNRQDGAEPFAVAQLQAGVDLVVDLCQRHGIAIDHIITHQACATPPGRKHDPGPLFPLVQFLADVNERLAA